MNPIRTGTWFLITLLWAHPSLGEHSKPTTNPNTQRSLPRIAGERSLTRKTANPVLTGEIVIKAVDLENDAPFLRVVQAGGGTKDYLVRTCDKDCARVIQKCQGGEKCAIRGKVLVSPPSILSEYVQLVSERKKTTPLPAKKEDPELNRQEEEKIHRQKIAQVRKVIGYCYHCHKERLHRVNPLCVIRLPKNIGAFDHEMLEEFIGAGDGR